MNFYKVGIANRSGAIVIPEFATPMVGRLKSFWNGVDDVTRAGGRFYPIGIGAATGGTPGRIFDALVNLAMDIVHLFLLLIGMYSLWIGLKG